MFCNVIPFIFIYIGVQYDFHFRWSLCCFIVTRHVLLVNQKLLTYQEHMSSSWFYVGFVLLNLYLLTINCLFIILLLATVLSVLCFSGITTFDYSFWYYWVFLHKDVLLIFIQSKGPNHFIPIYPNIRFIQWYDLSWLELSRYGCTYFMLCYA